MSLGLIGALVVYLAFLGFDIRGYLDYRFDQMVEHSAIWTDGHHFESVLELLRNSTGGRAKWILAKFISRKLSSDFCLKYPYTLEIRDMSALEYSDLLSMLVAEARERVYMACPLPAKDWLEDLFPQCSKYCASTAGNGEDEPAQQSNIELDAAKNVSRNGRCLLVYDPGIVRFAEAAFISPNTTTPLPASEVSCPLTGYGLPRHLYAVRLSGATTDKIRVISPPHDETDEAEMHYYNVFLSIQQNIDGARQFRVYVNPGLAEHSRTLFTMITGDELPIGKVFDYNVLDGIVIAWYPDGSKVGNEQEASAKIQRQATIAEAQQAQ